MKGGVPMHYHQNEWSELSGLGYSGMLLRLREAPTEICTIGEDDHVGGF